MFRLLDPNHPEYLRTMPRADVTLDLENRRLKLEAQGHLVDAVENLGKQWADNAVALHQRDRDFAVRLSESCGTQHSLELCNEWISGRLNELLAMQNQVLGLWLELATFHAAPASSHPDQTPPPDRPSPEPATSPQRDGSAETRSSAGGGGRTTA